MEPFVERDRQSTTSGNAGIAASIPRMLRLLRAACLAVLLCPATPLSAEEAYRLAPGDRITVTVFGQPELSGDVLIDDAGTISIPLTDPIEVKDLTLPECQKRIGDRLADGILRKPAVSVRIAE